MITYQPEMLEDVAEEICPLLEMHYQDLTAHKEFIKLAPDWDRYYQMEFLGRLAVFTARDDGKLIGYSIFFLDTLMHYKDTRVASNDVLYLHPNYRTGLGAIALIRLIRFSESEIKKIAGEEKIRVLWHIKKNHDFSPALHRMGYVDEEVIVGKLL